MHCQSNAPKCCYYHTVKEFIAGSQVSQDQQLLLRQSLSCYNLLHMQFVSKVPKNKDQYADEFTPICNLQKIYTWYRGCSEAARHELGMS